jgi:hypothetical protein
LNNLFSILLFSIILLNGKYAAEASAPSLTPEQQADIFIEGFKMAESHLSELDSVFPTHNHTHDCNVYTYIGELKKKFLSSETIVEKNKISDSIAILVFAHLLTPETILNKKAKIDLFEKLGIGRSDTGDYFIKCLNFNSASNLFRLSQFPAKVGSQLLTYQQLSLQMRQGLIPCSLQEMQEITEIGNTLTEIETLLEKHTWEYDDFFTNFETIVQTYEKLIPDFSKMQNQLVLFNEKAQVKSITSTPKIIEDRSVILKHLKDFAAEFRNPTPETIELDTHVHIQNLIQNRLEKYIRTCEFLESRIYTDTEKLLLLPEISGNPNSNLLDLTRSARKQVEVYQLAKEQLDKKHYLEYKIKIEKEKLSPKEWVKYKIQSKKNIDNTIDNLYVLLTTHSKSLMLEGPAEIGYIKLIIDFVSDSISQKAKDFSGCMHVRYYEDCLKSNIKVAQTNLSNKDILYFFKHDSSNIEPTRSYVNLLDTIQGLSLKETAKINDIKTHVLTILTEPFEIRIANQMRAVDRRFNTQQHISMFRQIYFSLLGSFTEVSPILIEYQERISEQMNTLNELLKNEPAYVAMQKKRIEDQITRTIKELEKDVAVVRSSTKKSKKKKTIDNSSDQKTSNQATNTKNDNLGEEKIVDVIAAPSSLTLTDTVISAPQQTLTAEQIKNMRKKENRLKRAELAKKAEFAKLDEPAKHKDATTSTAERKPFVFSPNANVFEPKTPIANANVSILPVIQEQQTSDDEKQYTTAYEGHYGQFPATYTGFNPPMYPAYYQNGQVYDPNYMAQQYWLAQQHFQMPYGPAMPYGYVTQPQYLLGGQEQQSHFSSSYQQVTLES